MSDLTIAEDTTLLTRVQAFLTHESSLLDDQLFEEWLALFDDDAIYWMPMAWQQTDPLNQVSIIYETKDLLHMRIVRLVHPATTSQAPPSRTCRQLTNTRVLDQSDESVIWVKSNFMMAEYRRDEQRIFAGFMTHELTPNDNVFRIRSKRVDLLNCDAEKGLLRFGMPL